MSTAQQAALIERVNTVLNRGLFTSSAEYILRCAEEGVVVQLKGDDFGYALHGNTQSHRAAALGEQFTAHEVTALAAELQELRSLDVAGAKTLPLAELLPIVEKMLDELDAEAAAARARRRKQRTRSGSTLTPALERSFDFSPTRSTDRGYGG